MSSPSITIAQGEVAKTFLNTVAHIKARRADLANGVKVNLRQPRQPGEQVPAIQLTAEQVAGALGNESEKITAALDAAIAILDAAAE